MEGVRIVNKDNIDGNLSASSSLLDSELLISGRYGDHLQTVGTKTEDMSRNMSYNLSDGNESPNFAR